MQIKAASSNHWASVPPFPSATGAQEMTKSIIWNKMAEKLCSGGSLNGPFTANHKYPPQWPHPFTYNNTLCNFRLKAKSLEYESELIQFLTRVQRSDSSSHAAGCCDQTPGR